jgi:hypothetical protein
MTAASHPSAESHGTGISEEHLSGASHGAEAAGNAVVVATSPTQRTVCDDVDDKGASECETIVLPRRSSANGGCRNPSVRPPPPSGARSASYAASATDTSIRRPAGRRRRKPKITVASGGGPAAEKPERRRLHRRRLHREVDVDRLGGEVGILPT